AARPRQDIQGYLALSAHRHRTALAGDASVRGGIMKLVIEPISAEAFAPYGTVVRSPAEIGRSPYYDALMSTRPDARATLAASRALPKTLPLTGTVMERHRFSSQTFFPLDVARYLIVVAPQSSDGMPNMRRARALMVPG